MRFFSSLKKIGQEFGRGIVNAKRSVCRGIGTAIEKVGDLVNNVDIEILGINIQNDNPYLDKQVDLNDSSTSVQDTIDIYKMCDDVRRQISLQAKRCEDDAVDQLRKDINKFIDILAEVFPEDVMNQFSYDIADAFEDDIHNTVSQYVSENISTDSPEFVKILNMSDAIREEKTKDYTKKVINKALALLEKKCRDKKISIFRKMCDDLESYFQYEKDIAKEYEKNVREMKEHMNDLEYCRKQAINLVTDISYMETIRTLTYGNS